MEGGEFLFKASLENNNLPELGAITVEFPIPEDQYEETIRALEKIKIGTTLDKDCCVANLRSTDCPALRRMINRMANVDELDWLGKQLESFSRYELLQFNAAAERFDLSTVGEMIDLSFRSREITVITDFNDLESVGKRQYLTLLLVVFNYLPMIGIVIAFKDYNPNLGIWGSAWNGLDNFKFFFTSQDAARTIRNTLLYSSSFLVLDLICAVGLALMFYNLRSKRALKFYNTVVILPRFMSPVIIAFIVYIILNPSYGLLNQLIIALGGSKIRGIPTPNTGL